MNTKAKDFSLLQSAGFSLIEVLISLILLSLCICFSAVWLIQASHLHKTAMEYTQYSLLGANIAQSLITTTKNNAASPITEVKVYWEAKLKTIHKDARLSISQHNANSIIVIETPNPNIKTLKWEVVSG